MNKLLAISKAEKNEYCFPLNIFNVQREQQKYLRKVNSKLITYISDKVFGYSKQALDNVGITCYDRNIYVPQTLHISVIDWYHLYLNHPGVSRLAKTIIELCYCKVLVTQAELYSKPCKIFQRFKKRKTIYGNLPHKNISELQPWYLVHVYLI